jgi:hypothetical protein
MRRMSFFYWWETFVPTGDPVEGRDSGYGVGDERRMFETYGSDLAAVQAAAAATPDCVWTLVDDGASGSIVPGFCFVNRLGYFITKHPARDPQREVKP